MIKAIPYPIPFKKLTPQEIIARVQIWRAMNLAADTAGRDLFDRLDSILAQGSEALVGLMEGADALTAWRARQQLSEFESTAVTGRKSQNSFEGFSGEYLKQARLFEVASRNCKPSFARY